MKTPITEPLIKLANQEWYNDPVDPRCPHDAWLDRYQIEAQPYGDRKENAFFGLSVILSPALAQGMIRYDYSGVTRFTGSLPILDYAIRRVDWLSDQVIELPNGSLRHTISWESVTWEIEARNIMYRWLPV